MRYRYARTRIDHSDLAAGQVLYNLPGRPAFPVRLAEEIFERCVAFRLQMGREDRFTLYDPCCGGGILLTTLGILHRDRLRAVFSSDVDPEALKLAERNLSLLTRTGLEVRIRRIREMRDLYGKESHARSLESASRLWDHMELYFKEPLVIRFFQANATIESEILRQLGPSSVDVVITDLPYGQRTEWRLADSSASSDAPSSGNDPSADREAAPDRSPAGRLLQSLLPILTPNGIVAVSADKGQKVVHEAYERLEQFKVGKRRVFFLSPHPHLSSR